MKIELKIKSKYIKNPILLFSHHSVNIIMRISKNSLLIGGYSTELTFSLNYEIKKENFEDFSYESDSEIEYIMMNLYKLNRYLSKSNDEDFINIILDNNNKQNSNKVELGINNKRKYFFTLYSLELLLNENYNEKNLDRLPELLKEQKVIDNIKYKCDLLSINKESFISFLHDSKVLYNNNDNTFQIIKEEDFDIIKLIIEKEDKTERIELVLNNSKEELFNTKIDELNIKIHLSEMYNLNKYIFNKIDQSNINFYVFVSIDNDGYFVIDLDYYDSKLSILKVFMSNEE